MNKILAVLAAITLASITSPVKADEVMDYTDYNNQVGKMVLVN